MPQAILLIRGFMDRMAGDLTPGPTQWQMSKALTRYNTVSMIWSIANDLLNVRGSSVSDINPKQATWATGNRSARNQVELGIVVENARTISKNDVGDCQKAFTEGNIRGDFVNDMSFGLNSNSDHG